jgi:hypothetical protein
MPTLGQNCGLHPPGMHIATSVFTVLTLAKLLKQQFKIYCALYSNQADPDVSASAPKIAIEF